jgi:hypothetical protein
VISPELAVGVPWALTEDSAGLAVVPDVEAWFATGAEALANTTSTQ